MYQNKNVYVIIAAAGAGRRMGGNINKQYALLCGIPVLARTLMVFQKHPAVDEIIVTVQPEDIEKCRKGIIERYAIDKANTVISGGTERQDSVHRALLAMTERIAEQDSFVLIHDGARPFVTHEEIDEVISVAAEHGAAAVGVPVKDTIKVSDEGGRIISTPDRKTLYAIKTPQAFQVDLIKKAFENAYKDGFYGTDETVLLERMGEKVYISKGEYGNIKITTPEDMIIGEALLNAQSKNKSCTGVCIEHDEERTGRCTPLVIGQNEEQTGRCTCSGIGYDVHAFADGRKLILGGVEVPHDRGLLGHSDADVLLHAIMDAMLGACGLGDIGRHFPDTDAQYKDISSLKLLSDVHDMLSKKGRRIVHIDSVIVAQKPRLSPHIGKMIANIANALNIEPERVNIKATTTERLGFEGREEGISAQAVATII